MLLKDKRELRGMLTGFPEEPSNRLCSFTGYVDIFGDLKQVCDLLRVSHVRDGMKRQLS
jgi:hypothetical protein